MASLIVDFLQVFNLDFSLAVFEPEINSVSTRSFSSTSSSSSLPLTPHAAFRCHEAVKKVQLYLLFECLSYESCGISRGSIIIHIPVYR